MAVFFFALALPRAVFLPAVFFRAELFFLAAVFFRAALFFFVPADFDRAAMGASCGSPVDSRRPRIVTPAVGFCASRAGGISSVGRPRLFLTMGRLLFLFVVVPAVELALLIELGSRIGTVPTLGLIAATGVIGASLARRQGLEVLRRLQQETNAGRLPADPLIDGVFLLVAGALLVTPGVLTDVVGFACLIPGFRRVVRRELRRRFERAVEEGRVEVHVATHDPFGPRVEKVVRAPDPPGARIEDPDPRSGP